MKETDLEMRVTLLEEKIMWNESTITRIDSKVDRIQDGLLRLVEVVSDYKSHTDERISNFQLHTDERISNLQAHMDDRILLLQTNMDEKFNRMEDRISGLQAQTDEKISNLQSHTDDRFVQVQGELTNIHKSITVQTRWMLSVILFGSVIGPFILKLLDIYL